jgi:hypothetical protein
VQEGDDHSVKFLDACPESVQIGGVVLNSDAWNAAPATSCTSDTTAMAECW